MKRIEGLLDAGGWLARIGWTVSLALAEQAPAKPATRRDAHDRRARDYSAGRAPNEHHGPNGSRAPSPCAQDKWHDFKFSFVDPKSGIERDKLNDHTIYCETTKQWSRSPRTPRRSSSAGDYKFVVADRRRQRHAELPAPSPATALLSSADGVESPSRHPQAAAGRHAEAPMSTRPIASRGEAREGHVHVSATTTIIRSGHDGSGTARTPRLAEE